MSNCVLERLTHGHGGGASRAGRCSVCALGTGDWGLGDWGLGDWGLAERREYPSGGPYEVEGWPVCNRPARARVIGLTCLAAIVVHVFNAEPAEFTATRA